MKQVVISAGRVVVDDVPAPTVAPKSLLVRVSHSCISPGTETASVALSGLPLYARALKRPDQARRVLAMARRDGIAETVAAVRARTEYPQPTGYSAAGTVVAVGEAVVGFAIGDRVACAGAGVANHAEMIAVPVNLAVRIPETVAMADAATATLGAIALQGVRRAAPTLGETVLVAGLGAIGLLAVQILRANGCRVIGLEPDARRRAMALDCGAEHALDPDAPEAAPRIHLMTGGFGADAAIVTASAASAEPLATAIAACRAKARVVVVGDVPVSAPRDLLYMREIDLLIATSYGPGRYDPVYEEEGQDYPLPYVRWTENRNMAAYLHLVETGAVSLDRLAVRTYEIADAPAAYDALRSAPEGRPVLCLLRYPDTDRVAPAPRRIAMPRRAAAARTGVARVALIGAGGFAKATLLPELARLPRLFSLAAVVSRSGANAKAVAGRFGARFAATDARTVLDDPDIDLVVIATRHDLHASLTLQALEAGKHVYVEKPLALTEAELDAFTDWFAPRDATPVLMTGFNRRFAPPIAALRRRLAGRAGPLVIDYRMNAGPLPRGHWVNGPEGGGRNLGEACHVYDLFVALTGSTPVRVSATAAGVAGAPHSDNFAATIGFADGSLATLTYSSVGDPRHPKEAMEVHCDGAVHLLDDYRRLAGSGGTAWRAARRRKGHREALEALGACLARGGDWPIPLADQLTATRIALDVEALLSGAETRT